MIGIHADIGIISEIDYYISNVANTEKLSGCTVHFPKTSNVNMMIVALLQKMRVKCIFYEYATISHGNDRVVLAGSGFSAVHLKRETDIVVNSGADNWENYENCITINTWEYKDKPLIDSELFVNRDELSAKLKNHDEDLFLAVQAVGDIYNSVVGGTFS
ncbi:MAG: hypothetical protein FWG90_09990 [Oscillospiraceae bacterium]|nr:hypothetical protein [Oscillospiraceae bacterium]